MTPERGKFATQFQQINWEESDAIACRFGYVNDAEFQRVLALAKETYPRIVAPQLFPIILGRFFSANGSTLTPLCNSDQGPQSVIV